MRIDGIDHADLVRRLRGKSLVHDPNGEALMPWVYQRNNPNGRPLHDDWLALRRVPRIKTAFRLPLPFKVLKTWGPVEPHLVPWQPGYPISPGAIIEKLPWYDGQQSHVIDHVLAVDPVLPAGQGALFGVELDGKMIPCFYTRTRALPFGRKVVYYHGLRFDHTMDSLAKLTRAIVGDFMCWYPEASFSIGTR